MGITAVHGRSNVAGSSTVMRYSMVFASVRVKRSTRCKVSDGRVKRSRPLVVGAIDELRGIDDQRVALPLPYGVAEPLPDAPVRTPVGGDDPPVQGLLVRMVT